MYRCFLHVFFLNSTHNEWHNEWLMLISKLPRWSEMKWENWLLLLRSRLYLGIPNCSSSNSAIFSRTRKRGPFVHCGSSFWTPPVNFPLRGRYKPQEHQVLSGRILISKRKSRKTNQATFSSHFCFNLVEIPSSSNSAHFVSSITMTQQALGFARS